MRTVSILGIGRAGGALAIALTRAGVSIDRLIYNAHPAELPALKITQSKLSDVRDLLGDILVIATPDPAIFPVAMHLASLSGLPKVALHLSGSLSSRELSPLSSRGVSIASMHPLVSISNATVGAERFKGSYFCVEGDEEAADAANSLVRSLGGRPFTINSGSKALYHASAVMASGSVTALFDVAIEVLSKCGLEPSDAHNVLLPLIESVVANLAEQSTEDALTGPFVRDDVDALLRHLTAFEGTVSDEIRCAYLLLAERSVKMAARSRSNGTEALAEAISIAKQKTGC